MANSGYFPPAGQQNTARYPQTGPNYAKYGEQQGWTYSPRDDKYYRDQAHRDQLQQYEEEQGLRDKPPKQQGLSDVILPVAATAGSLYLGKELATTGFDYAKDVYQNGFGAKGSPVGSPVSPSTPAPTPGAAAPTAGVTPTAPANSGLLGASGNAAPANISVGDSVQAIPPGTPQPPGTTAIGSTADGGVLVAPDSAIAPDGTLSADASSSLGAIAQGAGGALQLYSAYNMYKGGDKAGAGLLGAAGTANIATAAGADLGAYTVPGLNIAAGLYGGYQTAKYLSDAPAGAGRTKSGAAQGAMAGGAVGAGIGSFIPVVGTAVGGVIGAGVGGLAGAIGSWTGSDKDKYQMIRDAARNGWQEAGLIDKDYKGTLADGSQFDFGKDGKGKIELDYKDPLTGKAIGFGNAIAAGEGSYGRATDGLSDLYTGAMMSNAKGDMNAIRANALHFARQRGMNLANLTQQYQTMLDAGQINQGQYDAYLNGARDLFAGQPEMTAVTTPPAAGGEQVKGAAPTGQATVPPPEQQLRSQTRSPGIDLNGRRVQNLNNRGLLGAG